MNKTFFTESLGWYGVFALIGAYILVSFNILYVSDAWFQILNITGAMGITVDALAQKNWQPAVLNIVWAIVGIIALIKILQ